MYMYIFKKRERNILISNEQDQQKMQNFLDSKIFLVCFSIHEPLWHSFFKKFWYSIEKGNIKTKPNQKKATPREITTAH